MNLKVFLNPKNSKNSLFWAKIFRKPPQKKQKKPKPQKTHKNLLAWFFLKTRVFSNPGIKTQLFELLPLYHCLWFISLPPPPFLV
jgi:hypothetical protein